MQAVGMQTESGASLAIQAEDIPKKVEQPKDVETVASSSSADESANEALPTVQEVVALAKELTDKEITVVKSLHHGFSYIGKLFSEGLKAATTYSQTILRDQEQPLLKFSSKHGLDEDTAKKLLEYSRFDLRTVPTTSDTRVLLITQANTQVKELGNRAKAINCNSKVKTAAEKTLATFNEAFAQIKAQYMLSHPQVKEEGNYELHEIRQPLMDVEIVLRKIENENKILNFVNEQGKLLTQFMSLFAEVSSQLTDVERTCLNSDFLRSVKALSDAITLAKKSLSLGNLSQIVSHVQVVEKNYTIIQEQFTYLRELQAKLAMAKKN